MANLATDFTFTIGSDSVEDSFVFNDGTYSLGQLSDVLNQS